MVRDKLFRRRLGVAITIARHHGLATLAWRLLGHWRSFSFPERFLGGWALPPEVINIYLTNACNLRCGYCVAHDVLARGRARRLDWQVLSRFIEQNAWYRPVIYLTGGEPFLYPHLIDLIRLVASYRLVCTINTNGTILDEEVLATLVDVGLDSVTVSIDGREAEHDAARGEGSWAKAVQFVQRLAERKRQARVGRPHIRINTVITDGNLGAIVDIYRELKHVLHNDIDFHQFQLMSFLPAGRPVLSRSDAFLTGPRLIDLSFGGNQEVLHRLMVESADDERTVIVPGGWSPEEWFSDRELPQARCVAVFISARILADGAINPCLVSFGNIADGWFLRCWNSPAYRHFRRDLLRRGLLSDCFRCCGLSRGPGMSAQ